MIESIHAISTAAALVAPLPPPVQAPQPRAERPPEHVAATAVASVLAQAPLPRRTLTLPDTPAVTAVALAGSGRPAGLGTTQARQDPAAAAAARQAYARALREALALAAVADRG